MVKDISDEVADAKGLSEGPLDPWRDYIDWNSIRMHGSNTVIIDGVEWEINKWGPQKEVPPITVKTLDQMIGSLSPKRREKIANRTKQLIASLS